MAKKFAELRSRMTPAARARAKEHASKVLAEIASASSIGRARRRGSDFLKIAAISASVSYKETLAPEELARILLSGEVPSKWLPHLRVVLEELPPSVLKGLGEQLSDRMTPEELQKNLAAIARQVGL